MFGRIEWDSPISERASELAKSEACRPKGGSHGKAVILCAKGEHNQVHKRVTKKHSTSVCLVGLSGLEPPTPTLSGWCSNLLSYNPILWWRYTDSFSSERLCLHIEASVSEDSSSGTSQSDALRPQRNAGIFTCGGDTRIRTEDLLNANQALYQLSYIPT